MAALRVLLLVGLVVAAKGCIYKYGSNPAEMDHTGAHYSYSFGGLDWTGPSAGNTSAQPWVCGSGLKQSPINLMSLEAAPLVTEVRMTMYDNLGKLTSTGSNVNIINSGHTIQVEWTDDNFKPLVSVAVPGKNDATKLSSALQDVDSDVTRINAIPQQFHFHAASEHILGGRIFPLEMHIVSKTTNATLPGCGAGGCYTVVGILFELDQLDNGPDNEFLKAIFDEMPLKQKSALPMSANKVLDFSSILPANKSYATYEGSLTTPPCSEGILWHVMLNPVKISFRQWEQFKNATGDMDCTDGSTAAHARRRLLAEAAASTTLTAEQKAELRSSTHKYGNYTCTKLGGGTNARMVQKLNGRVVRAYIDTRGSSRDDVTISKGGLAGIVIGVAVGAALLAAGVATVITRRRVLTVKGYDTAAQGRN